VQADGACCTKEEAGVEDGHVKEACVEVEAHVEEDGGKEEAHVTEEARVEEEAHVKEEACVKEEAHVEEACVEEGSKEEACVEVEAHVEVEGSKEEARVEVEAHVEVEGSKEEARAKVGGQEGLREIKCFGANQKCGSKRNARCILMARSNSITELKAPPQSDFLFEFLFLALYFRPQKDISRLI
jgi:bifunctional N-acetylglucosamine-1-phosphate-uridyltransferase/glucosamine-1-phosphate-acetyltransferase GlmU-like protein